MIRSPINVCFKSTETVKASIGSFSATDSVKDTVCKSGKGSIEGMTDRDLVLRFRLRQFNYRARIEPTKAILGAMPCSVVTASLRVDLIAGSLEQFLHLMPLELRIDRQGQGGDPRCAGTGAGGAAEAVRKVANCVPVSEFADIVSFAPGAVSGPNAEGERFRMIEGRVAKIATGKGAPGSLPKVTYTLRVPRSLQAVTAITFA